MSRARGVGCCGLLGEGRRLGERRRLGEGVGAVADQGKEREGEQGVRQGEA